MENLFPKNKEKTDQLFLQKFPSLSFSKANLVLPENFNIAEKCATIEFSAKSSFYYTIQWKLDLAEKSVT